MKRIHIILILSLLIAIVYYLQSQTVQDIDKEKIDCKKEIEEIISNYDSTAFKAFYSLDELRPYSIVQIDKLVEIYEHKWIPPSTIVSMLDSEDKSLLSDKIVEMLEGLENTNKQKEIIAQIKNWCVANNQLNYIAQNFDINFDEILRAISTIKSTQKIFFKFLDPAKQNVYDLTPLQKDEVYTQAVNIISALPLDQQLKYISEIYKQLSVPEGKKE